MENMLFLEPLREQVKIQGYDGNWNYDQYMHGMFNGLECALATLENREANYREKPDVYLCDIKLPEPVLVGSVLLCSE